MEITIYVLGAMVIILLLIIAYAQFGYKHRDKIRRRRLRDKKLQSEMDNIREDINTSGN
jgi:hypothetical protein